MKPPGSYKLAGRTRPEFSYLDPLGAGLGRGQKIIESLRSEIMDGLEGPTQHLRIRRVFRTPREIYRVELEVPEMSYSRTTLLDRDSLEDLLASDEVRDLLVDQMNG
jgi:hypothetical protein